MFCMPVVLLLHLVKSVWEVCHGWCSQVMAGLRESVSITDAVQPTPTCGVREEAHFICGVLEEAVMGFYALSPRVVAEALGLRRLILEPQPREEAETKGTPRLSCCCCCVFANAVFVFFFFVVVVVAVSVAVAVCLLI